MAGLGSLALMAGSLGRQDHSEIAVRRMRMQASAGVHSEMVAELRLCEYSVCVVIDFCLVRGIKLSSDLERYEYVLCQCLLLVSGTTSWQRESTRLESLSGSKDTPRWRHLHLAESDFKGSGMRRALHLLCHALWDGASSRRPQHQLHKAATPA